MGSEYDGTSTGFKCLPAFCAGFCGRFRIEGQPVGRYRPLSRPCGMSPQNRPGRAGPHIARHDTMKLRSLLLVSCMLVVPALAMFSHLIPAEMRAAARHSFATATSDWLGTPAEARTIPPPPAALPPAVAQSALPVHGGETLGFLPAATGGAAAATPPPRPAGAASSTAAEPATPPLVTQLADRTRQLRDQQAREQQAIEAQLKSAGAVSFDCQPLPGAEGLFSSSCRVPMDATGQLQRVFQASGHDPGTASAALLAQVTAWRQRMAMQEPPATAGGADGTRARMLIRELKRLHEEAGSAFRVEQIAGGFRLLTRAALGPWVRRVLGTPTETRLSAAAIETLAIVAYRQPVTRAEIEAIRGVGCEDMLRQLMERDFVAIGGRTEDLGRPNVYVTSRRFLEAFGLAKIEDLPQIEPFNPDPPAGTADAPTV